MGLIPGRMRVYAQHPLLSAMTLLTSVAGALANDLRSGWAGLGLHWIWIAVLLALAMLAAAGVGAWVYSNRRSVRAARLRERAFIFVQEGDEEQGHFGVGEVPPYAPTDSNTVVPILKAKHVYADVREEKRARDTNVLDAIASGDPAGEALVREVGAGERQRSVDRGLSEKARLWGAESAKEWERASEKHEKRSWREREEHETEVRERERETPCAQGEGNDLELAGRAHAAKERGHVWSLAGRMSSVERVSARLDGEQKSQAARRDGRRGWEKESGREEGRRALEGVAGYTNSSSDDKERGALTKPRVENLHTNLAASRVSLVRQVDAENRDGSEDGLSPVSAARPLERGVCRLPPPATGHRLVEGVESPSFAALSKAPDDNRGEREEEEGGEGGSHRSLHSARMLLARCLAPTRLYARMRVHACLYACRHACLPHSLSPRVRACMCLHLRLHAWIHVAHDSDEVRQAAEGARCPPTCRG